jgi:hypothetical protein
MSTGSLFALEVLHSSGLQFFEMATFAVTAGANRVSCKHIYLHMYSIHVVFLAPTQPQYDRFVFLRSQKATYCMSNAIAASLLLG